MPKPPLTPWQPGQPPPQKPPVPFKTRVFRAVLFVLGCGAGLWALSFFWRCPIQLVFGIPCPGCGMTRAAFALLRLDFAKAFYWHPMIYPLAIGLAGAMFVYLKEENPIRRRNSFWWSQKLWYTLAGCMVLVWAVRLSGIWKGIAPNLVDPDQSLLKRLIK